MQVSFVSCQQFSYIHVGLFLIRRSLLYFIDSYLQWSLLYFVDGSLLYFIRSLLYFIDSYLQCVIRQHFSFTDRGLLQGGKDSQDALCCRSLSAKELIIIGLFCAKRPIKIRHLMTLRHPVPYLQVSFVHYRFIFAKCDSPAIQPHLCRSLSIIAGLFCTLQIHVCNVQFASNSAAFMQVSFHICRSLLYILDSCLQFAIRHEFRRYLFRIAHCKYESIINKRDPQIWKETYIIEWTRNTSATKVTSKIAMWLWGVYSQQDRLNHRSLLKKRPIKETLFYKRDL